jgi:hypothetical protein
VGADASGDDIGDTPYVLDANNTDMYPLISQWGTGTPVAGFTWVPLITAEEEPVIFDASYSMPRAGIIINYKGILAMAMVH